MSKQNKKEIEKKIAGLKKLGFTQEDIERVLGLEEELEAEKKQKAKQKQSKHEDNPRDCVVVSLADGRLILRMDDKKVLVFENQFDCKRMSRQQLNQLVYNNTSSLLNGLWCVNATAREAIEEDDLLLEDELLEMDKLLDDAELKTVWSLSNEDFLQVWRRTNPYQRKLLTNMYISKVRSEPMSAENVLQREFLGNLMGVDFLHMPTKDEDEML